MRRSVPRLARYLEAGSPTGLTGLRTHPTPRYVLLNTYRATLEKLQRLPESSLYRQSVEAVTKNRLALAEKIVPPGFDTWQAKVNEIKAEKPDAKIVFPEPEPDVRTQEWDGGANEASSLEERVEQALHETTEKLNMATAALRPVDKAAFDKWVAEEKTRAVDEGDETVRTEGEMLYKYHAKDKPEDAPEKATVQVEHPPDLTTEQIAELENSIGAGLIEEVIQVAEGELKLVGIMTKAQVWEPLEEKPEEGQWAYFERK